MFLYIHVIENKYNIEFRLVNPSSVASSKITQKVSSVFLTKLYKMINFDI